LNIYLDKLPAYIKNYTGLLYTLQTKFHFRSTVQLWHHIEQNGGHRVDNLLRGFGLVTGLV